MNDSAREILDRYLDARTPDADRQAAAWAAIDARIAAGDPGPALAQEPTAGAAKGALLAKGFLGGIALAGLVYLGAQLTGGTDPDGVSNVSTLPTPVAASRPVPTSARPARGATERPPLVEAGGPEPGPSEVTSPRARKSFRSRDADRAGTVVEPAENVDAPAGETAAGGSLAEEMALLGQGQRALRAGDPVKALALFDTHARRYPEGALADERELKRAQALCALGDVAKARAAAAAFVREKPGSPLAGKASRICAEDPS
jgi:hypothetical protein